MWENVTFRLYSQVLIAFMLCVLATTCLLVAICHLGASSSVSSLPEREQFKFKYLTNIVQFPGILSVHFE